MRNDERYVICHVIFKIYVTAETPLVDGGFCYTTTDLSQAKIFDTRGEAVCYGNYSDLPTFWKVMRLSEAIAEGLSDG